MAMDDQSFLQKLRMNNVFPGEGQGLPRPLIGMPNFDAGRQQGALQSIGNRVATGFDNRPKQEEATPPMNYEYKPPESDKFATNIIMGTSEEDKHRRAMELSGQK